MGMDKYDIDILEKFVICLQSYPEGKKILEDIEYWSVKYTGNGLYSCGPAIFGKRGLEEMNKALRQKALEYGK
jgi:hypothetical protein